MINFSPLKYIQLADYFYPTKRNTVTMTSGYHYFQNMMVKFYLTFSKPNLEKKRMFVDGRLRINKYQQ
jgi:hypothetical protein